MQVQVDPAQLRCAAGRLEHTVDAAFDARAAVTTIGPAAAWTEDQGVQGAFAFAIEVLERMTRVAYESADAVVEAIRHAADTYEATEQALSGRDRRPS